VAKKQLNDDAEEAFEPGRMMSGERPAAGALAVGMGRQAVYARTGLFDKRIDIVSGTSTIRELLPITSAR
jgi:hypothetical protein